MGDLSEGNPVAPKSLHWLSCRPAPVALPSTRAATLKHVRLISVGLRYADFQFHLKAFSFVTPVGNVGTNCNLHCHIPLIKEVTHTHTHICQTCDAFQLPILCEKSTNTVLSLGQKKNRSVLHKNRTRVWNYALCGRTVHSEEQRAFRILGLQKRWISHFPPE